MLSTSSGRKQCCIQLVVFAAARIEEKLENNEVSEKLKHVKD